jgi:SpoVK/Ycf46/Vps4 family AAA+-type ATPase
MTTRKSPQAKPFRQWEIEENGRQFRPVGSVGPKIVPGFYRLGGWPMPALILDEPKHDTIIHTGLAAEIAANIEKFLAAGVLYQRLGFLHKRGVLLIGYPGTGKSMTAMCVADKMIANGAVVLLPNPGSPGYIPNMLGMVRSVEPDCPIMVLMEDIEEFYEEDPDLVLDIMDGSSQTNNIVYVGTTNFPERLDSRFLDRPGRFDVVRWVGPPDAKTRDEYIRRTLPKEIASETIEEMVKHTEGLLLSHLREVICGVLVQGKAVEEVCEDLRAIQKRSQDNDEEKKKEAAMSNLPPSIAKQMKDQAKALNTITKAVAA